MRSWCGLDVMLLLFTVTLATLAAVEGEGRENNLFAAIEHMKPLVELEKAVVMNARVYMEERHKHLQALKPLRDNVEEAHQLLGTNPRLYHTNPINSYKLIHRLNREWKELSLLNETTSEDANVPGSIKDWLTVYNMYTPSDRDITGATFAFIRLQDNYGITAREFADGQIGVLEPSKLQLTAADCMAIADQAHAALRYVRMKEWLLEAERLIMDKTIPHRHGDMNESMVHEYLAWSYYLESNAAMALKYTELAMKTSNAVSDYHRRNRDLYRYHIENDVPMEYGPTKYMEAAQKLLESSQTTAYVRACRGEGMQPHGYFNVWNLRSYYRNDHPLLYLKPLKVTQLHDNPEIWLLHDILSETTMTRLKEVAGPRLDVAKVVSMVKDAVIQAQYRVSKNMFLMRGFEEHDALQDPLDPMFDAITGLNMKHAETLQMNNYGLGGQYEFHHDYGEPGTIVERDVKGNRLATLLLYLSDVERGGHTVFTEIGVSLPPIKGSGVLWYNLHRNGTGIHNTRHASCPVISGSKWVANKWIRMAGNELRRPCTLNRFE